MRWVSSLPSALSVASLQNVRGMAPRLQMLDDAQHVVEELKYVPRFALKLLSFLYSRAACSIEKWNTDTLEEYLLTKLRK